MAPEVVFRSARRPVIALAVTVVGLAGMYALIVQRYRLPTAPILNEQQGALVLRELRASLSGGTGGDQARLPVVRLPGPVWATVYHRGEPLARVMAGEGDLARAVTDLARQLGESRTLSRSPAALLRDARIKIDLLQAAGPVFSAIPAIFALSVAPGIDGVGLRVGNRRAYLLPDDLFRHGWLAAASPFFFMHEFRTGLDTPAVITALARQLSLTLNDWRRSSRSYFRFRLQSFVEASGATGAAHEVVRLRVPVREVHRAQVRQAAEHAADYVLRQQRDDGRFRYIYYPLQDTHSPDRDYNLPRHAGTTWFLSLAYRELGKPRFKVGARRAIEYLVAHAIPPACRRGPASCVGSDDYASLGAAALALVAMAEYQQVTGDKRFAALAERVGRFVREMQRPNGDFCHVYRPRQARRECHQRLLYYSGEATFALAKLYQASGQARLLQPIERALGFLVDEKYDFFLGKFIISEDHWTCLAAEAAPRQVRRAAHLSFCKAFGRINTRAQVRESEPLGDLAGAFSITPFFMPHNTPAASRTEANISSYLLSRWWKRPDRQLLATIRRAIRYLVDQQLRDASGYLLPNPARARGGMLQTPVRPQVRIDYVQHAASAMLRALPLIPE